MEMQRLTMVDEEIWRQLVNAKHLPLFLSINIFSWQTRNYCYVLKCSLKKFFFADFH